MSVRLMTAVFDRYPTGGGEFTLALALADNAHDDGSHIYPTVRTLAKKTRQSERAVQYQLRRMEDMGWLQLVNAGDGGRGQAREYRIDRRWIEGGDMAPMGEQPDARKGANLAPPHGLPHPQKGAMVAPGRVQNEAEKGAPVAPAINHKEPSLGTNTPPTPCEGAREGGAPDSPPPPPSGRTLPGESAKDRKPYPHPVELATWLADCKAAGVPAIPPDDPVFGYCEDVGLSRDVLALHWREFVRRRKQARKRQKAWEQTFRNSVQDNWYGLWVMRADGSCELSTKGRQAKAHQQAEDERRAAEERGGDA